MGFTSIFNLSPLVSHSLSIASDVRDRESKASACLSFCMCVCLCIPHSPSFPFTHWPSLSSHTRHQNLRSFHNERERRSAGVRERKGNGCCHYVLRRATERERLLYLFFRLLHSPAMSAFARVNDTDGRGAGADRFGDSCSDLIIIMTAFICLCGYMLLGRSSFSSYFY